MTTAYPEFEARFRRLGTVEEANRDARLRGDPVLTMDTPVALTSPLYRELVMKLYPRAAIVSSAAFLLLASPGLAQMATNASNAVLPDARSNLLPGANTSIYYATDAKGALSGTLCTWDGATGHDVGDCINGAIASAATNGGEVKVPCGAYYASVGIAQHNSGVHLRGCGVGAPRTIGEPTFFHAYTRLLWNGAAAATLFDLEPSGTNPLESADVMGIEFDCNAIANICAQISDVEFSNFEFGVAEPRLTGAYITTKSAVSNSAGDQHDIFYRLYARATSTSDTYHPTGILMDGLSATNISLSQFLDVFVWFNSGDGLVVGNSDNNDFLHLSSYPEPSVSSGRAIVFANGNYTMPNGQTTKAGGSAYNNQVFHTNSTVYLLGHNSGITVTAGGANTGPVRIPQSI
jgi:hypothetical protein